MDIIFYHPTFDTQWWIEALRKAIPQARVRAWKSGDNDSADYALVWHPPVEMLAGRDLKAVFALGAGVDSILSKLQAHPEMLKPSVPLFRLEDTGMGEQMQEYAVSQRFPLRCWSRTRKSWPGVQSFAGREELSAFLSQCRVLINLLPNTPETVGIINQQLLEKLPDGAYLLNLARGVHVVEDDLLAALDSGKVKGAMLDVFNREPLPPESPLWQHPRVTITPHVAAITRPAEAVEYISRTIAQLEKGERLCGQVDRARGY